MTGDDLRTIRNKLGLSQAGLARLLDVDVMTISRWERGVQTIQHPRILELALQHLLSEQSLGHDSLQNCVVVDEFPHVEAKRTT